MSIWHHAVGTLGLWVGLSNHRPILVSFQNLTEEHLNSVRRFNNKEFGSQQQLHIKDSPHPLPSFRSLRTNLTIHGDLSRAAVQLEHLTYITLAASPERKK